MRRSSSILLGTTALLGLGTGAFPPSAALAAEARPGGSLDITVSGFVNFLATLGEWDATQLDDGLSTGLDFENDTEIHVIVGGKHEPTGIEYGATVEFDADTNNTANTDETWVFLQGGFGELRLGDEDGVADEDGMALSAAAIAAGTGGLDGTQVDTYVTTSISPLGTSDSTKIIYETPSFGGFQVGVSYTPNVSEIDSGADNGDNLASTDVQAGDVVEGALAYEGELGDLATELSLSGLWGEIKDDTLGSDDYWAAQAGAVVELFDVSLAGSYLREKVGDFEQDAITLGIGYEYGPLLLSVNWGYTLDADDSEAITGGIAFDNASNLIFSATYTLMPGLTLGGDLQYVDNDLQGASADAFDDDSGVAGVVQLGLAF